jgi:hypothetical protein
MSSRQLDASAVGRLSETNQFAANCGENHVSKIALEDSRLLSERHVDRMPFNKPPHQPKFVCS